MTESRVAFEANGKILVGKAAVGKANHIYDVKRMIGLNWGDEGVSEFMKQWPFEVKKSAQGSYNI